MISMAPAQDRTAQIVETRSSTLATEHGCLTLGSFLPKAVSGKRSAVLSLCQAGLRGHLTYQRACTKIRVRGCFLSYSTGGGLLPAAFGVLERKLLAPSGPKRVFFDLVSLSFELF